MELLPPQVSASHLEAPGSCGVITGQCSASTGWREGDFSLPGRTAVFDTGIETQGRDWRSSVAINTLSGELSATSSAPSL